MQSKTHIWDNYFGISRNIVDIRRASGMLVFMNIQETAAQLEALGNPTRLAIYQQLVRAGDSGLSVGSIQQKLNLAGSTLSHHLKSLVIVDLVRQDREGTTLYCRANYPVMRTLVDFLVAECCVDENACCTEEAAA
jgi:ArsR family transcriptional regulator, arsenate/arsenite/antimonite-responsive transcriptional repressor